MKKEGFISMTLVYTFLIVFLFLMLAILNTYLDKDKYLEAINNQINMDITKNNETRNTLISAIIRNNPPNALENSTKKLIYTFDISNSKYSNGMGLYYTNNIEITDENSDGTSGRIYFFRGETESNHIVYAEKCFRILRTNEDGSLRIVYNGPYTNGKCMTRLEMINSLSDGQTKASIGREKYNDLSNSERYVKYMYTEDGTANIEADDSTPHSNIKDLLDNWYLTEIKSKTTMDKNNNEVSYEKGISDAVYCNDTIEYKTKSSCGTQGCTSRYYGANSIVPRFIDNSDHSIYNKKNITNTVTYKCAQNDAYTLTTSTGGNKLLFFPVGTLTAADVVLAGGYMTNEFDLYHGGAQGMENKKYFLYTGEDYWTMSPYATEETYNGSRIVQTAEMVYLNKENGVLEKSTVTDVHSIIPVISIKGTNEIVSGNGTAENPYKVKMEE